jgi:hypothetical protein
MPGDELKAMLASPSNSRCDTPETVTKPTQHSQCESYRRLMKNTKIFSPLMWLLLLGSVALAQAGNADVPETPQPQESATAKIEAAKVEATKIEPTAETTAGASSEGRLISQARRYAQLHPGRMQPPGQAYRSRSPMPGLSPLGALIGFGAGAALGASKSQDQSASARAVIGLFAGGIGALIGGAIGTAPPFWHSRRNYPLYGPGDDDGDDSNLRSHNRTIEAQGSVKKPVAASTSSPVESAGLVPQEELAVP